MLKKVILLNFLLFFSFTNSFGFLKRLSQFFIEKNQETENCFNRVKQELIEFLEYNTQLKQKLTQEDLKFFSKKYRINKINNFIELETNQKLIIPENQDLTVGEYESLYIYNKETINFPKSSVKSYLMLDKNSKIILKRGARLIINGIILQATINNFKLEDVSYTFNREEKISNGNSQEPIILITELTNPGLANDVPKIIYNKNCDLNNLEKNISDQNLILKN